MLLRCVDGVAGGALDGFVVLPDEGVDVILAALRAFVSRGHFFLRHLQNPYGVEGEQFASHFLLHRYGRGQAADGLGGDHTLDRRVGGCLAFGRLFDSERGDYRAHYRPYATGVGSLFNHYRLAYQGFYKFLLSSLSYGGGHFHLLFF